MDTASNVRPILADASLSASTTAAVHNERGTHLASYLASKIERRSSFLIALDPSSASFVFERHHNVSQIIIWEQCDLDESRCYSTSAPLKERKLFGSSHFAKAKQGKRVHLALFTFRKSGGKRNGEPWSV